MGSSETRHFFPLTSLQIGDLQSYLSRLTIFLTPNKQKIYILVDNRPWLIDQDTKPAHLWQLMVTKSRRSPFANTKTRRRRTDNGKKHNFSNNSNPRPNPISDRSLRKWYNLIDAAMHQKRTLLPVKTLKDSRILNKELHRTLYGFIIFEVEWANVRGINYINELQTDTSLALETKLMKRWEFESIEQASISISLWFHGGYNERQLLQQHLDGICPRADIFYDAHEDSCSSESINLDEFTNGNSDSITCFSETSTLTSNSPYTEPPRSGPYKRRKIIKSKEDEPYSEIISSPRSPVSPPSFFSSDSETLAVTFTPSFEATTYKNVFILFRFDDHDLPFKLKEVIVSDLRLLTLLEYGLPSWVIFLQSYPLFCNIYRPWMCPLARALYVLMSVITVLIGFYDLYKNVPLLKATLSRLFGPFFDWIENREMISRLKYLGTMLFLHNFEQAVKWGINMTRAMKSMLTILTRPIAGPVMEIVEFIVPLWNLSVETVESFGSAIWVVIGTSLEVIVGVGQFVLWPFWLVLSTIVSIATYVIYPLIWVIWEVMFAPVRLILAIASLVATVLVNTYCLLRETWSSISLLFQLSSATKAAGVTSEASIWRTLWNDLFSHVFRALRSILYGFVAFFSTCNRHRLSTYNYILGFFHRLSRSEGIEDSSHSCEERQKYTNKKPLEGSRKIKVR